MGLNEENNPNSNNMVETAAEKGNLNAIKLLNTTKNHILPKKIKEKTTYQDAIKQMTVMSQNYMKKATFTSYA